MRDQKKIMKVVGGRDGPSSASFHREDAGMSSVGEGPNPVFIRDTDRSIGHRNPLHAAMAHGERKADAGQTVLGRKIKEIQEQLN